MYFNQVGFDIKALKHKKKMSGNRYYMTQAQHQCDNILDDK